MREVAGPEGLKANIRVYAIIVGKSDRRGDWGLIVIIQT